MRRIGLIFNPTAGGPRGRKFIAELPRLAPHVKIVPTDAPGDAQRLAAQFAADGFDTVVAGGGDGTINDVINGLAARLRDGAVPTRLGVLPFGTQNVFATELGIPNNPQNAWKIIEKNHARAIDLPQVNYWEIKGGEPRNAQRFFGQLAGIGLDARAVQEVRLDRKRMLGPLEYILAGLKVAAEKPPHLKIEADHAQLSGTFVVIGNGRYYGGPFALFPDAANDDGKFDVCVFQRGSYLDYLRYFQGILRGVHPDFPDVQLLRSRHLRVTSSQSVPLEVDGEMLGYTPANFDVWPRALRVLVP